MRGEAGECRTEQHRAGFAFLKTSVSNVIPIEERGRPVAAARAVSLIGRPAAFSLPRGRPEWPPDGAQPESSNCAATAARLPPERLGAGLGAGFGAGAGWTRCCV